MTYNEDDSGEDYFYKKALIEYYLKQHNIDKAQIDHFSKHEINMRNGKHDIVKWEHSIDQPSIQELVSKYPEFKHNIIRKEKDNIYFFTKYLSKSGDYQFIVSNLTVLDIFNAKLMLQLWQGTLIIKKIFLANGNLVCNFLFSGGSSQLDIVILTNNCQTSGNVEVNFTDSSQTVYAMK